MGKKLFLLLACMFMTASMAFAQKQVQGTVTDSETGEPIVGAAVKVTDTTIGTLTDVDGKFTLKNVPSSAKTLTVSFMGMKTEEVQVRNVVAVTMVDESKSLGEVMVVAYGTQKRSSFTGSATELSSKDIEAHIATNATSALQGSAPGIQVTSASGNPTDNAPSIRIRGLGSMLASNAPLIILDGAPYEGSMSSINSQDIDNMTVLKDAASCAIYGPRGANGVILITTKKGKSQDAEIKFDARWGSNSRLIPQYDVITSPGQFYETAFTQLYNSKLYYGASASEAYNAACSQIYDENNGGLGYQVYTVPDGQNLIGTNLKLNPNATLGYSDGTHYFTPDDWYDEAFHNSFRQEYNISASGKTDRLNYYASGAYLKDGGVVNNSDFDRYTSRLNTEYRAKDWLTLRANMGFTHSSGKNPYTTTSYGSSGNMFYVANNIAPIYPLYVRDANGQIMKDDGRVMYDNNQAGFVRAGFVGNPIRDNEYDKRKFDRDMLNGNWAAVVSPIEGLKLTASLTAMSNNYRSTTLSSVFGGSSSNDGQVSVTTSRTFDVNNQYLAEYDTYFGGNQHHLTVIAGYDQERYKYQYLYGWNSHLYNPYIGELGNATGEESQNLNSYTRNRMNESVFGRVQYDLMDRYFLSGTVSRNGSSRFAPGHRWGTFGSAGAAWLINKEKFFNADWVNELKLKVSYGVTGNDNLDDEDFYLYTNNYTLKPYNYETGLYAKELTQAGNTELTWEKSQAFNVGVDFALFDSRLSGSVEFFNRKTTDMLYYKDMPLSKGITGTYPVNVGNMVNRGIEANLNGSIIRSKNITLDANLNLTHYKNEITALDPSVSEHGIISGTSIRRVGGSIYEGYMYKYAGVCNQADVDEYGFSASDLGKPMYWQKVYATDGDGNQLDANGDKCSDSGLDPVQTGDTKTVDFGKADRYDVGSYLPKVYGGFGLNLKVYGFDFSTLLAFQLGGKIYDGTYQRFMHTQSGAATNWHKDILKAWTPENTNTDIPRLDAGSDSQFALSQSCCDRFLTSARYLSINNVTLGYTLPDKLFQGTFFKGLRVYCAGENLAVFSARKGLDPRFSMGTGGYTSGTGLASDYYSARRTVTFGVTLNF